MGVFLSSLSKHLVPYLQGNIFVSLLTGFITVRRGLSNPQKMKQQPLLQTAAATSVALKYHKGTCVNARGERVSEWRSHPLRKL